jgi:hypothetical protein
MKVAHLFSASLFLVVTLLQTVCSTDERASWAYGDMELLWIAQAREWHGGSV